MATEEFDLAIEARKWHGMSSDDEGDAFHFFSSSCNTWMGPYLFFLAYFMELLEAHDFLKETQFHS